MEKKKMIVIGKVPKQRNPIARLLCENNRFQTKAEPNKKKQIPKFDLKKETWD